MTNAARSTTRDPLNAHVANVLDETARLLEEQRANPFRVQAYRNAADTVRGLRRGVDEILDAEGLAGLDRLPGIGQALARVIDQVVTTGRFPMLERLHGASSGVAQLASIPGIGATLAQRLRDEHGIGTLEQLEIAAHDGTLAAIAGFGEKRIAGIQDVLATRLGRRSRREALNRAAAERHAEPSVEEILDIDREYRDGAVAGTLPRIAPRRFNPTHAKWLPILHATRGGTYYTALYSNTARAHERGTTHDWVVIYFDRTGMEGQRTVVTAASGALTGRRIVRGRELECERYYAADRGGHAA
jgi:DNA polymerase (family 10)